MCVSESAIITTTFEIHYRGDASDEAIFAKNLIHDKTKMMLGADIQIHTY